jgi:transposase-like protein
MHKTHYTKEYIRTHKVRLVEIHLMRYALEEPQKLLCDLHIAKMGNDLEEINEALIRSLKYLRNVKSSKWSNAAKDIQESLGFSTLTEEEELDQHIQSIYGNENEEKRSFEGA